MKVEKDTQIPQTIDEKGTPKEEAKGARDFEALIEQGANQEIQPEGKGLKGKAMKTMKAPLSTAGEAGSDRISGEDAKGTKPLKSFGGAMEQIQKQRTTTEDAKLVKNGKLPKEGKDVVAERSHEMGGSKSLSSKILKDSPEFREQQAVQGQGVPLSAYFERAAQPKGVEQISQSGLQISEIEKLVDRVMVGVNEVGEPEFKIDMRLDQLGDLNVKVTRTEGGLQIVFNAETEKGGMQLGQNLQQLQTALAEKGLQVSNIQLMVQNQPVSANQLIQQPRTSSEARSERKDTVRTKSEKASKPTPRTR